MLDPEDIEQIRRIFKEELDAHSERQRSAREKELNAERQRRYRERHRVTESNVTRNGAVTQSNGVHEEKSNAHRNGTRNADAGSPTSLPLFSLSDSPSLSPSSPTSPTIKNKTRPRDLEDVRRVCSKCGLPDSDAVALWEHWNGNNFTNNGKRMGNWEYVVSNWERRGIFFPSRKIEK